MSEESGMWGKSNLYSWKFSGIFLFITSTFLGISTVKYGLLPFFGFIAFLFIMLLLWKPHLGFPLVVLMMIDCFGFFNPETFVRIKDFFKFRDLLFVALFVVIFLRVCIGNSPLPIKKSPLNKIIFGIIGLTIFEIFHTIWLYDVPLISAIQTGRVYFFYLVFFPALYFWDTKEKLFSSLKIFLVIALIGAFLIIIRTVFGQGFTFPPHARLDIQPFGGFTVNRLYLPGLSLITIAYSILFWLIIMNRNLRHRGLLIVSVTLLGAGWFLFFGRAVWVSMFVMMAFPIIFIKEVRIKRIHAIGACMLIILLFAVLGSFIIESDSSSGFTFIFERIGTIVSDVRHQEGTFGSRIAVSQFRFEALKDHFVLGAGFLHAKLVPRFYELPAMILDRPTKWGLGTVDWGLPTLLIHFGILGFLWFVAMVVVVHKRMIRILKRLNSPIEKSIVVAALSYFWGAVTTFLTSPNFTYYGRITTIVVLWAAVEALYSQRNIAMSDPIIEYKGV